MDMEFRGQYAFGRKPFPWHILTGKYTLAENTRDIGGRSYGWNL